MKTKALAGRLLRSTLLSGMAAVAAPAAVVTASAVFTPAAAQDYTSGALTGTIYDGSGNAVSGATVTITSVQQGFSRTTTTGGNGAFRFAALPNGSYDIEVSSSAGSTTETGVGVRASETTNYNFVVGAASSSDTIVVQGTRQVLDFANTTTGVNLDVEQLVKDIPVGRNLTSLTLLAPTAAAGDQTFGNLSSLGGSSVAENAYYINGLNVTNFDNYLGGSLIPFEFYKSVEVKTGGYPAEFGRATGGVVNAVSKTGTNEWKAAFHLNWEPDSLSSDAKDTFQNRNQLDETRNFDTIIELGGPIIKDRLFVYGLAQFQDDLAVNHSISNGARFEDRQSDPIWAGKVDFYPIDNHHFELTYIDTTRTTERKIFDYTYTDASDNVVDVIGGSQGTTLFPVGGESFVGKYTGTLTEWLTVSGAYGINKDRNETIPDNPGNYVLDDRGASPTILSSQVYSLQTTPRKTRREFFRADVDLYFSLMGDHHVRAGFDKEDLTFQRFTIVTGPPDFGTGITQVPGGVRYTYFTCDSGTTQCDGMPALADGTDFVEVDFFNSGGTFDSENTAYYFQDEWNPTDRLTLNLGVRYDEFTNSNGAGGQFVDLNGWAPRTGFSYDVFGDGRARFYGNFGVYYLPVASNTAFRQSGQEYYFQEYWTFSGMNGDSTPILDQQLVGYSGAGACPFGLFGSAGTVACNVTGDGTIPATSAAVSQNLKPTKEQEIIVGYEQEISDLWTLGIAWTHRDLKVTAEDSAIDAGVRGFCAAEGIVGCDSIWTGFHQYVIANPNSDILVELSDPLPGETDVRSVVLAAEDLGYPDAVRKYDSVEFTFNRAFDGVWSLQGSYTWSNSRGNSEGYVQSDYGQTDAGITIDFDQPGFTDGAYGKLPNHRAHQFKIWGAYQVTEQFRVGANAFLTSPRKGSCFGNHMGGFNGTNLAYFYGNAAHYCGGVLQPRGTGRDGVSNDTDWIKNIDVSLRYDIPMPTGTNMTVRADVFNVFNFGGVTERYEFGEASFSLTPRTTYGEATRYQTPRYVRFGVDLEF